MKNEQRRYTEVKELPPGLVPASIVGIYTDKALTGLQMKFTDGSEYELLKGDSYSSTMKLRRLNTPIEKDGFVITIRMANQKAPLMMYVLDEKEADRAVTTFNSMESGLVEEASFAPGKVKVDPEDETKIIPPEDEIPF